MRIQPDSTVTLYGGVDIDMTSGVQIAFSSIANQRAYFASKLVQSSVNCTTVKKTGALRLEVAGSVVKNCNYLSFVNPSFDNKVWYARITDYNYVNNECTEISYLIDFWQTFMFDVDFEPCGIQRQYLNNEDFYKAETNPYDPSIYAFQTSEGLPFDKNMEEYTYNYKSYATPGAGDGTWDIDENCYLMHVIPKSTSDIYKDARHDLFQLSNVTVICLTPIDFARIGMQAETHFAEFLDDLLHAGGYYSLPNGGTIYQGVNDNYGFHVNGYEFLHSFARPYYIIAIPSGEWEQYSIVPDYDPFTADFNFHGNKLMETLVTYLTAWDCISSIIGIHSMPERLFAFAFTTFLGSGGHSGYSGNSIHIKNAYVAKDHIFPNFQPHCKKLYMSPYTFLRLENNTGDVKEYSFERFKGIQEDVDNTADVVAVTSLNVNPTVMIAPCDYKMHTDFLSPDTEIEVSGTTEGLTFPYVKYKPGEVGNVNFDERIEMSTFPEVPFTTDGYLTFLAGKAAENIKSNTMSKYVNLEAQRAQGAAGMVSNGISLGKDAMSTVKSLGGASVGALAQFDHFLGNGWNDGTAAGAPAAYNNFLNNVQQGARDFSSFIGSANQYKQATMEENLMSDSERFMQGTAMGSLGNPHWAYYDQCKAACAKDEYYPGTQGGITDYYLGRLLDFKLTFVKLRDVFLEKYDLYFKTYGYNFAGMVGTPYVCNYVKGQSTDNAIPHWESVNSKLSTYIKTVDCHCTHNMLPVSVAIESMFNGGIRMLKGEFLTPSSTR